jgi:hypothetical protein
LRSARPKRSVRNFHHLDRRHPLPFALKRCQSPDRPAGYGGRWVLRHDRDPVDPPRLPPFHVGAPIDAPGCADRSGLGALDRAQPRRLWRARWTKAARIDRKTGILPAVQLLLGRVKLKAPSAIAALMAMTHWPLPRGSTFEVACGVGPRTMMTLMTEAPMPHSVTINRPDVIALIEVAAEKRTGGDKTEAVALGMKALLEADARNGALFGAHPRSVKVKRGVDLTAPGLDVDPEAQSGPKREP